MNTRKRGECLGCRRPVGGGVRLCESCHRFAGAAQVGYRKLIYDQVVRRSGPASVLILQPSLAKGKATWGQLLGDEAG